MAEALHNGLLRFSLADSLPRSTWRATAVGAVFFVLAAKGMHSAATGGRCRDRSALDIIAMILAPHIEKTRNVEVRCKHCKLFRRSAAAKNAKYDLCYCDSEGVEGESDHQISYGFNSDDGADCGCGGGGWEAAALPSAAAPRVRFPHAALRNAIVLPKSAPVLVPSQALVAAAGRAKVPLQLPRFAVDFEFASCGKRNERWVFPVEVAAVEVATGRHFHATLDPCYDADMAHLDAEAQDSVKQTIGVADGVHGLKRRREAEWGARRDHAAVFAELCAFLRCPLQGRSVRLPRLAVKCDAHGGGDDLNCLRWLALKAGYAGLVHCAGVVSVRVADRRSPEARQAKRQASDAERNDLWAELDAEVGPECACAAHQGLKAAGRAPGGGIRPLRARLHHCALRDAILLARACAWGGMLEAVPLPPRSRGSKRGSHRNGRSGRKSSQ